MKRQYENISPNNVYTSLSFLESLDENNLAQSLKKCMKLNNENMVTFQNYRYQKNRLTSALCQSLTRPDIGRGQGKDLKKTRLFHSSLVSSSENITLRDELSSSNNGGVSETVNAYVHLKGSNKDIREPSYILDVHQSSSEDDYKQIPDPKELREVMVSNECKCKISHCILVIIVFLYRKRLWVFEHILLEQMMKQKSSGSMWSSYIIEILKMFGA